MRPNNVLRRWLGGAVSESAVTDALSATNQPLRSDISLSRNDPRHSFAAPNTTSLKYHLATGKTEVEITGSKSLVKTFDPTRDFFDELSRFSNAREKI